MGKTVIEKILSARAGKSVRAGDTAWIKLDLRTARDFGGANVVKHFEKHWPKGTIPRKRGVFFTFDCQAPAKTIPYAENQQICRNFAKKMGIKVFDVDRGIGTHVLFEEGLVRPGMTAVGTDSHFNIMGAFGAFGQGMGDVDIAYAFKTGRTWFKVPETIKIILKGKMPSGTEAKDLALFLLGKLGTKTAHGKAIEVEGDAVDSLSLDGRITFASMATEMGAIAMLLPPNEKILHLLSSRVGEELEAPPTADSDASYSDHLTFDISGLEPMAAAPPSPTNVKPVKKLKGTKVDSVFIGSCTNGRYEDFHLAADLFKGKSVYPGVMVRAVPATREVYTRILESGELAALHRAGVIVSNPGCGGCASGQIGMTGKGEVQLSTSNRNFPGKQGAGDTYLVGVKTAVLSAIKGEITA